MNSITEETQLAACELLLSLIFPANRDTMTAEKWDAFVRAVEAQAEFDANSEHSAAVRSRSVGDVSVTYADTVSGGVSVDGHQIAPAALAILKNNDFLCRWV